MVSLEKVHAILEKYRVPDSPVLQSYPAIFTWDDNGIYSAIKKRVRSHFEGPDTNYKADLKFWAVCYLLWIFQAFLIYEWAVIGCYGASIAFATINVFLGFMVFHTGGHCGLSKNPKVNSLYYRFVANYMLGFIDRVWDIHHNYAHHGYTNVFKLDPDLSNWSIFLRKTEMQRFKIQHKWQQFTIFLGIFIPNQWFGQVLFYYNATWSKKIFGTQLYEIQVERKPFHVYFAIYLVLFSVMVSTQGLWYAFLSSYLFSVTIGLLYWGMVFPNHDTGLAEHSDMVRAKNVDWGEHQIRTSSNFKLLGLISYLMGGMNYQIEHHLFPTVHPRHYPMISKIVREECKKRNIPYHLHTSWFDALIGHMQLLRMTANPGKKASMIGLIPAYIIQNTQ